MPTDDIDGAALAEDRERDLDVDVPAAAAKQRHDGSHRRGMSLVEQPVDALALPPHVEIESSSDRLRNRDEVGPGDAKEVAPLDAAHDAPRHAGALGNILLPPRMPLAQGTDDSPEPKSIH